MTDNFGTIYCNEVYPYLKEMENKRKIVLFKVLTAYVLFGLIVILPFILLPVYFFSPLDITWIFELFSKINAEFVIIPIVLVMVGALILFQNILNVKRKFELELKEQCLEKLLQSFCKDIYWSNHYGCTSFAIPYTKLHECELFPKFTHMNTDDEFNGIYNNTPFALSEIKLMSAHSTGRFTSIMQTTFQGIVIKFRTPKFQRNKILVTSKKDFLGLDSWKQLFCEIMTIIPASLVLFVFGEVWSIVLAILLILTIAICGYVMFNKESNDKLQKIDIKNKSFAMLFNLYSSDNINQSEIFNKKFIDLYNKLASTYKTKKIKFIWEGSDIIFAINSKKNLFEIGTIYKPLTKNENIKSLYNELLMIFNLIDFFKE